MDVKRQVKWMSGAFLSILFVALPVQTDTTRKEPVIVAGPIGKTSSASARVTLVIPPKPDKAKQATAETTAKPAEKKNK